MKLGWSPRQSQMSMPHRGQQSNQYQHVVVCMGECETVSVEFMADLLGDERDWEHLSGTHVRNVYDED